MKSSKSVAFITDCTLELGRVRYPYKKWKTDDLTQKQYKHLKERLDDE